MTFNLKCPLIYQVFPVVIEFAIPHIISLVAEKN